MVNPIRTKISVKELHKVELFLSAHKFKSIKLGVWSEEDPVHTFMVVNKICYSISNPSKVEEADLIFMKLKFGNLAQCLEQFTNELR